MTRYDTVPIEWNERYSVGVRILDQHHRHLAGLINQLSERTEENIRSEKMVDILTALVSYAEYHFRHEEDLMAAAQYHELDSHRAEHQHFCEVIAETCYGATLGIIGVKELFAYLTRWWKNQAIFAQSPEKVKIRKF